jgi:hypothetical protein
MLNKYASNKDENQCVVCEDRLINTFELMFVRKYDMLNWFHFAVQRKFGVLQFSVTRKENCVVAIFYFTLYKKPTSEKKLHNFFKIFISIKC